MFLISKEYPEGQHKPETGYSHNWHVWCKTGAIEVLERGEWRDCEKPYTVNFANGAYARTARGDMLWDLLAKIAESHRVSVFPNTLRGQYTPWSGKDNDCQEFDAIKIEPTESLVPASQSEKDTGESLTQTP